MKSLNLKLMTLAATLAIAATTASAQVSLRAKVPFSFEVNGTYVGPAGNYAVNRQGDAWIFTNQETRHKALAVAVVRPESSRTDKAKMVFECRGNNCTLRSIQTGGGETGALWPARRPSKSETGEAARRVIVNLTPSAE